MLNIAIKEAIDGTDKTKLRAVADALVSKAMDGDIPAIKEVADRLDGKVPQGIIGGGEDDPPVSLAIIELRGVRPDAVDSSEG